MTKQWINSRARLRAMPLVLLIFGFGLVLLGIIMVMTESNVPPGTLLERDLRDANKSLDKATKELAEQIASLMVDNLVRIAKEPRSAGLKCFYCNGGFEPNERYEMTLTKDGYWVLIHPQESPPKR